MHAGEPIDLREDFRLGQLGFEEGPVDRPWYQEFYAEHLSKKAKVLWGLLKYGILASTAITVDCIWK